MTHSLASASDPSLLGGSGKTDVLLHARLGRSDSYKVTVDAKTTASGRLRDMQVDWATLAEHRTNEGADHSLLVGPNPSGDRLFDRAVDYEVTVLSAQQTRRAMPSPRTCTTGDSTITGLSSLPTEKPISRS